MKLHVSPKELLALHNVLHSRISSYDSNDDAQLTQLYNRLRTCIISSLGGQQKDDVGSWLKQEQSKIDKLRSENEAISSALKDPDFFVPDHIMSDDENEVDIDLVYPSKKVPSSQKRRRNRGNRK